MCAQLVLAEIYHELQEREPISWTLPHYVFFLLFDPPILYFINLFLFYELVFTIIWPQFLTREQIK